MRTAEGRISGYGVTLAFTERDGLWRDKKVWNVKFPDGGTKEPARTIRNCTIADLDNETKLKYNLI